MTVCVRVRPRNQKEIDSEMPEFFAPTDDGLNIQEKKEDMVSGELEIVKNWSYDYCFGRDNDNKYIFHSVGSELVDASQMDTTQSCSCTVKRRQVRPSPFLAEGRRNPV